MRNINATELARLFGINQSTLRGWKHAGLIKAASSRHGRPDEFTPETALRVGLTLALRRRGLPISTCNSAYLALGNKSMADLQASVAKGERWLMCIGPTVSPTLLREAAIDPRIGAAADSVGLVFATVDVGAAIEQLAAFLDDSTGRESSCVCDKTSEPVPA